MAGPITTSDIPLMQLLPKISSNDVPISWRDKHHGRCKWTFWKFWRELSWDSGWARAVGTHRSNSPSQQGIAYQCVCATHQTWTSSNNWVYRIVGRQEAKVLLGINQELNACNDGEHRHQSRRCWWSLHEDRSVSFEAKEWNPCGQHPGPGSSRRVGGGFYDHDADGWLVSFHGVRIRLFGQCTSQSNEVRILAKAKDDIIIIITLCKSTRSVLPASKFLRFLQDCTSSQDDIRQLPRAAKVRRVRVRT